MFSIHKTTNYELNEVTKTYLDDLESRITYLESHSTGGVSAEDPTNPISTASRLSIVEQTVSKIQTNQQLADRTHLYNPIINRPMKIVTGQLLIPRLVPGAYNTGKTITYPFGVDFTDPPKVFLQNGFSLRSVNGVYLVWLVINASEIEFDLFVNNTALTDAVDVVVDYVAIGN